MLRLLMLPLFLYLSALAVPPSSVEVQSFQEWKAGEVRVVKSREEAIKAELADLTAREFIAAENQVERQRELEQLLNQCKFNLELVSELSVNDYFVLYLSRFSEKRQAFLSAATKLSPPELAELMMAYDKFLENTRSAEPRAASWMGNIRSKSPNESPTL